MVNLAQKLDFIDLVKASLVFTNAMHKLFDCSALLEKAPVRAQWGPKDAQIAKLAQNAIFAIYIKTRHYFVYNFAWRQGELSRII